MPLSMLSLNDQQHQKTVLIQTYTRGTLSSILDERQVGTFEKALISGYTYILPCLLTGPITLDEARQFDRFCPQGPKPKQDIALGADNGVGLYLYMLDRKPIPLFWTSDEAGLHARIETIDPIKDVPLPKEIQTHFRNIPMVLPPSAYSLATMSSPDMPEEYPEARAQTQRSGGIQVPLFEIACARIRQAVLEAWDKSSFEGEVDATVAANNQFSPFDAYKMQLHVSGRLLPICLEAYPNPNGVIKWACSPRLDSHVADLIEISQQQR